jgi:hypothetical protein
LKEAIYGLIGKFFSMKTFKEPKQVMQNSKVKALLKDYKIVFLEPKHLLPTRQLNHKIPLILGAKLVNSKPY